MIERYKERTGSYPERILADKIYRNRENPAYCVERKIRLSGPALGRPKKDEIRDKKQDYIDEAERVKVEPRVFANFGISPCTYYTINIPKSH